MPAPIDPGKREAIADAIRDGGKRNAIAREHHVSPGTVTRIARQLETQGDVQGSAFDRAACKDAREARLSDLADRRAGEAVASFDDAQRIRAQLFEPRDVVLGKGDDARVVTMPPAARDVKDLAVAYGILLDKSRSLTDADADPADVGRVGVLALVDELRVQRDADTAIAGGGEA